MKLKLLAVITIAGISASAFGQGVILQNIGTSTGGTNGAVFMANGTKFDGLVNNLGVTVSGGASAASLQPIGIGTFTAATDPKGYTGLDIGVFQLGATAAAVDVPGVAAGGIATIRLQMWFNGSSTAGLFGSFTAAQNGGGEVADVSFLQNTGNPPLTPPGPLNGMPDVHLAIVPEPSTLALAGLGIASLLAFRRRN
jgi:hypothetical protein